jgi:branched-chain amino acid aminotransferase
VEIDPAVCRAGPPAELTPVTEIDQRRIGTGKPGPITQALQKAFFDVVGGTDAAHRQWLTPV